jgi:hypothetical protein
LYTIKWTGLVPKEDGWSPPSDTICCTRDWLCLGNDQSLVRVVGDAHPETGIDVGFVLQVGFGEQLADVSDVLDHATDHGLGRCNRLRGGQLGLGDEALGLNLGYPTGDHHEISAT